MSISVNGGEQIKRETVKCEEEGGGGCTTRTRRAEPDDYARGVSKIAVAQICEGVGFEAIKQSALEAFSDIAVRYICDLGKSASCYANLAGRSESNFFDILKAFEDFGYNNNNNNESNNIVKQMMLSDISAEEDNEIPFVQPIPRFPIPVNKFPGRLNNCPSFLQMGETSGCKHIPDWLPAFPDRHTYVHSPMWNHRKFDLRIDKGGQARQRRKAERSLLNLQQRLLSNCLAAPSCSAFHANAGETTPGAPIKDNQLLAPPLPSPAPAMIDAIGNGVRERKHVLVKETFAPAIDALKGGGTDAVGASDSDAMDVDKRVIPFSIPDRRRPVVHFRFKAGKKMLVEDLDVHLRNKVNDKRVSLLGRDDDKDDKKRRAEFILRQSSVDNPQELSQM